MRSVRAVAFVLACRTSLAERRVALVTGASSGIGEALARGANARGFDLLLTARREARLDELAREFRSGGTSVVCVACDLATPAGVDAVCRAAERLDVGLVCLNAGVCQPHHSFPLQPAREVASMLDLNVQSNTRLLAHFCAQLAASGAGGHILLVGSSAGTVPGGVPGVAVYASTKAYLRSLAAGVGAEMRRARCQVSVTCALPSAVDSGFAAASSLEESAIFALPGVRAFGGVVLSAEAVAERALDAALKRRAEVVPGVLPRLFVGLSDRRFLPRPVSRAIAAFSFGPSPFAPRRGMVARRHDR